MAGIDVSIGRELLPGLLSGQDGLAKLLETILNQLMEAQLTEALGAERHERSEERTGYRNGTRLHTLYTRVGPNGQITTSRKTEITNSASKNDIRTARKLAKNKGLCK